MIIELGHVALCLAIVAAAMQSTVPLWGVKVQSAAAMQVADSSAQVQFLATVTAFGALTYAYIVSDFSLANVALNSHSGKPMLYKITGVWANHEGSMLLWVVFLALFGVLISVFGKMIPVPMRATVLSVQGMIGVGFLAFILITSNPFERITHPPLDGQGMNPLLQDPGLAFHPPLLYLGYVGFSTAFSFAVAALIMGRVDPSWARWMRPWVLLAWSGLTAGIALGSWWAYYELGWGGFWFWDPVENASFMPWLLGTALLHSAIVVEKRAAMLTWTLLLSIFTFALSLIGTFLVRSGILSSVHAFATDPSRGSFILALILIALIGALVLYVWRAPKIQEGGTFSVLSRESGLLINNMLLAASTAVVLFGTLYPLFLEMVSGDKVTVGAPYFNKTFLPIFAIIMFLAALGPFLSWKRAQVSALKKWAGLCLLPTIAVMLVLIVALDMSDGLGIMALSVTVWLAVSTLVDLGRRAGLPKTSLPQAMRRIIGMPPSAWAMYTGHMGIAVVAAGVIAISIWRVEVIQVQEVGTPIEVGPYEYTLSGVESAQGPNYQTSIAYVEVTKDGVAIATLTPERRWYPVERKPTTEAGIVTHWHGDFYAVLGDPNGKNAFVTRYYYNPGVPWMWFGAALITLSGLMSLNDRRLRIGVPTRRQRRHPPSKPTRPAPAQ